MSFWNEEDDAHLAYDLITGPDAGILLWLVTQKYLYVWADLNALNW